MNLKVEQYLALSSLAYQVIPNSLLDNVSKQTLEEIVSLLTARTNLLELKPLSSLASWHLINATTTSSGMSAIAVQDPATKDIVFAYRGTDIDKNIWEAMKDIESDLAIASSGNVFVQDGLNQFYDAYTFYTETIKKVGGGAHVGTKSFTGHSLGGGLAQYMAYKTGGAYKTVTFDAVGIGQVLKNVNPRDYDASVTDYTNEHDIIGMYGVQLGRTVYIKDMNSDELRKKDRDYVAILQYAQGAIAMAARNGEHASAMGWMAAASVASLGYAANHTSQELAFDAHRPSSLLTDDGTLAATVPQGDSITSTLAGALRTTLGVYTGIANGVHFIVVEIPSATAEELVRITLSVAESGKKIIVDVAQVIRDEVNILTSSVYETSRIMGEQADAFARVLMTQLTAAAQWTTSLHLDIAVLGALSGAARITRDTLAAIVETPDAMARWLQMVFGESIRVVGTSADDRIDGYDHVPDYGATKRAVYVEGRAGNDYITGTNSDDTLIGEAGDDNIEGKDGDDMIFGGDGNDSLHGGFGSDTIFGGAGDDQLDGMEKNTLYGGTGNDSLGGSGHFIGGPGDDEIYSQVGDDTYRYNRGDGNDTISDFGGVDTVRFGAGIVPSDVTARYESRPYGTPGNDYDLVLDIKSSGSIRIKDYYGSSDWTGRNRPVPGHRVERFVFADGTVWDEQAIRTMTHNLQGTADDDSIDAFDDDGITVHSGAGNDTVRGARQDANVLYGDDGDDSLIGGEKDDVLVGGQGNDVIYGAGGNDTYTFKRGDGIDTIDDNGGIDTLQFGEGINPRDVTVRRIHLSSYESLELAITGTGDKIIIQGYFGSYSYDGLHESTSQQIEKVVFADGTVWTPKMIAQMLAEYTSE
jgi:hypothetical protein